MATVRLLKYAREVERGNVLVDPDKVKWMVSASGQAWPELAGDTSWRLTLVRLNRPMEGKLPAPVWVSNVILDGGIMVEVEVIAEEPMRFSDGDHYVGDRRNGDVG